MLLTHIGHAEFLMEWENGVRLVTDPYDESCGYPVRTTEADAVLVSHHHRDHDAVSNVTGYARMIDREGETTVHPGIRITALTAAHDAEQGAERGMTLLFLIEAEGLRVVHLGDLGCLPDEKQEEILKKPDVLMIPVGGTYTIDAETAKRTAEILDARIIVPMHYRTKYNSDWPIAPAEDFLRLYPMSQITQNGECLRITHKDISCHRRVVVL